MDAKQLQENGRQLIKAYEAGDPPSTILTLLAPLENFSPTEDLLRSSKIGVVVAKVRNSKDAKVASVASQLVNKWKAAVKKKPGGGSPHAAGLTHVAGVANGGRSGSAATGSPAPAAVKKEAAAAAAAPKKYAAAPEKRSAKEDGVKTSVTGNTTRDGCITLIYNGLCFMSTDSPDDILSVSSSIEVAAFDAYNRDTTPAYKQKVRSLHLNLKMKENSRLRRDVFSGDISPDTFVKMSSEELKSEDKRKSDAALQKENMNKAMTAQEEKAISTTYVLCHHLTSSQCKEHGQDKHHEDLILHLSTPPSNANYAGWRRRRGGV